MSCGCGCGGATAPCPPRPSIVRRAGPTWAPPLGLIRPCENFSTPAGRSAAAPCRGWYDITDYVDWLEAATEATRAMERSEQAILSAPSAAVPEAAQRFEAIRAAYRSLAGFPLTDYGANVARAAEVATNARCLVAEAAASSRVPVVPPPPRPVPPPPPAPQPWNWWPFPSLSDYAPWLLLAAAAAALLLLSGSSEDRRR